MSADNDGVRIIQTAQLPRRNPNVMSTPHLRQDVSSESVSQRGRSQSVLISPSELNDESQRTAPISKRKLQSKQLTPLERFNAEFASYPQIMSRIKTFATYAQARGEKQIKSLNDKLTHLIDIKDKQKKDPQNADLALSAIAAMADLFILHVSLHSNTESKEIKEEIDAIKEQLSNILKAYSYDKSTFSPIERLLRKLLLETSPTEKKAISDQIAKIKRELGPLKVSLTQKKAQAQQSKAENELKEIIAISAQFEKRLNEAKSQEDIEGWEQAFAIMISQGKYAAIKEKILHHEEVIRLRRKAQDMAERFLIDAQNGLEGEKYTEEEEATYPLHAVILNADDHLSIKSYVDSLDDTSKVAVAQERNSRGQTPLMVAIVGGNLEKVKLLFKLFPDSLEMSEDRALEKWRNMNPNAEFNPEESSIAGQKLKQQNEEHEAIEKACTQFKETFDGLKDRADLELNTEKCENLIDEIRQYHHEIDRYYEQIDSREDGTKFKYKNQLSALRTAAENLLSRLDKEHKALQEQEEGEKHLASCKRHFESLEAKFNDLNTNQDELSRSLSAYIEDRKKEVALAQNGDVIFGAKESELSKLKQRAENLKILLKERSRYISEFQVKLNLIVNPNGDDILSQLTNSVKQIVISNAVFNKETQKQIDKQLEEFLKEIDEKIAEVTGSDRVLAAELDKIRLDAQRMKKKLDDERTCAGYLFQPLPESNPELLQNVIYVSEEDGCGLCQGLDPEGRPYEEKTWIGSQSSIDEQLKDPDFQRVTLKRLANQGVVSYSPQRDWQFVLENLCRVLNAARAPRRAGNLAFLHEALEEMGVFYEDGKYQLKLSEAKNGLEYNDYLCDELSLIEAAFDLKKAQERQEKIKKLYVQQFKLDIDTNSELFLDLSADLQKAIRMVMGFPIEDLEKGFDVEAAQKQAEKGLDEEDSANLRSTKKQLEAYAKESTALVELQRKLKTSTAELTSPEVRRKRTVLEQLKIEKELIIGRKEQFFKDKATLLEKKAAFKKDASKLSAAKTKRETLEADISQNRANQEQKLEEQKGIVKKGLSDLSKKFPETFFSFVTQFFIPEVRLAVEIAAIQKQVNGNSGFDPKSILGQIKSATVRFEQESGDSLIFGAESDKIVSAQKARDSFAGNESTFLKANNALRNEEAELKSALPSAQKKENSLVKAQSGLQSAISELEPLVSEEKEKALVEAEKGCDKEIKELKTALETASAENEKLQSEVEAKQKPVGEVKAELMKRKRLLTERLHGIKSSGDVSALQRAFATRDENYESPSPGRMHSSSEGAVSTQDTSIDNVDFEQQWPRPNSENSNPSLSSSTDRPPLIRVKSDKSFFDKDAGVASKPSIDTVESNPAVSLPSSPEDERLAQSPDQTISAANTPKEQSTKKWRVSISKGFNLPMPHVSPEPSMRDQASQQSENDAWTRVSPTETSRNGQTFLADKRLKADAAVKAELAAKASLAQDSENLGSDNLSWLASSFGGKV